MNILITGAMGYVGTALTKHLLYDTDHKLTLIDRFEYEVNKKYFDEISNSKQISVHKKDIRDLESLKPLIEKSDCVVNLAALVGEPLCQLRKDEAYSVNSDGAMLLSDLCRNATNQPLFIQMSTCSNYGLSNNLVNENSSLNPTSVYAESKIRAEMGILNSNPHAIIFRCSTAFGLSPGRTRFDLLLNEFVRDAHMTKKLQIFDPNVFRPLLHLNDISRVILHFIEKDNPKYNVYNVGSSKYNFTKIEIANKVLNYFDNISLETIARKDSRSYKVDFSRLENEMNFRPQYSLDDGVIEILEGLNASRVNPFVSNA